MLEKSSTPIMFTLYTGIQRFLFKKATKNTVPPATSVLSLDNLGEKKTKDSATLTVCVSQGQFCSKIAPVARRFSAAQMSDYRNRATAPRALFNLAAGFLRACAACARSNKSRRFIIYYTAADENETDWMCRATRVAVFAWMCWFGGERRG